MEAGQLNDLRFSCAIICIKRFFLLSKFIYYQGQFKFLRNSIFCKFYLSHKCSSAQWSQFKSTLSYNLLIYFG